MLSREDAYKIALEKIKVLEMNRPDRRLIIVEKNIIEKDYAFVFPYTTEMHYKTGDRKYAVPGLGPVVVNRYDKTAHLAPTNMPIQKYLEQYKAVLLNKK